MLAGGGGVTVSVTAALVTLPSAAVIWVVPAATAVAFPLASTVATDGALLDHVKVWPVTVLPLASLAVAVNCWLPPTVMLGLAGATETLDTVGGGVVLEPPVEGLVPPQAASAAAMAQARNRFTRERKLRAVMRPSTVVCTCSASAKA